MRKFNDRKSCFYRWRQSGIQHWRFQFSGLIRAFLVFLFSSWGTLASAQVDSLQKDRAAFRQAESLYQSGQTKEAAAAFKLLVKSNNTAEAAHFRLSTLYYQENNQSQALYHIDKALEFCKNCDDYLLQKAQILNANAQYFEAGQTYIEAINLNPQFWSRYPKAIAVFKNANNSKKVIEVLHLWEKQFQLKPEIGLKYLQEFASAKQIDSVVHYSKKLLLKYPNNKEILEKTRTLHTNNDRYSEFASLLKSRYLLDTNNIDYQLEVLNFEGLVFLQTICEENQHLMSTRRECKYFSPRIYYEKNKALIQKIVFNKNLNQEQKSFALEFFLWSEQNIQLLDSCIRVNYSESETSDISYVNDYVGSSLYSKGKFKDAEKYITKSFYSLTTFNDDDIETTLLCLTLNANKLELEKCKNYLEEAYPFMSNQELFEALNFIIDKNYKQAIAIISSIPSLNKKPNSNLMLNTLAYAYFQNSELQKAASIWNEMNIEKISIPFLINAYQCMLADSMKETRTSILNMAYFLGSIDLETKTMYQKSQKLPKK